MPTFRYHIDKCPCGSGRLIKDCCLKPIGSVRPTAPSSIFRHPKCYAQSFEDCSQTISGEHFISASILKVLERFGSIVVSGMPWLPAGESKYLSVGSLKSNILCKAHNSTLSPLDRIGTRFFCAFPNVKGNRQSQKTFNLFHGTDLERWMLKTLCSGIVSGQLHSPTSRLRNWLPPLAWLNCLFNGASLPSPLGMYFLPKPGDRTDSTQGVKFSCIADGDQILGLLVELHGLSFILAMVSPAEVSDSDDDLLAHATFRPSSLVIKSTDTGAEDMIFIDWWPNDHKGGEIQMNWHNTAFPRI